MTREAAGPSNHPQTGRSHWLLLLLNGRNAPILRDPRRSIKVGGEAVCLLDEIAETGDPDLVGLPVLEDLGTSCRSLCSAFVATSGRIALKRPRHYPRFPSNHA